MALIFVDVEAYGGCPATGQMTEFGAVEFKTRKTFHGVILKSRPSAENPAIPEPTENLDLMEVEQRESGVAKEFDKWLQQFGTVKFVSDNVAYDWQWINDLLHRMLGFNRFGHSGRRIGDFYAGLVGNFYAKQDWKRLRVTKHTHNPVDDAMGNVEAFQRLLDGDR